MGWLRWIDELLRSIDVENYESWTVGAGYWMFDQCLDPIVAIANVAVCCVERLASMDGSHRWGLLRLTMAS